MKVYILKRRQFLPIGIDEAWTFFSAPANLVRITPEYMKFRILHMSGTGGMFPGQIIRYRLFVLPFIPWHWTTEITHVQEPHYFVDEQRFGPYAFWHHQHHFRALDGGIEMTDEVNYAISFGFIGRILHRLLIRRQLNRIFEYRYQVLEKAFNGKTLTMRRTA